MKRAKIKLYYKPQTGMAIYEHVGGFYKLSKNISCVLLLSLNEYDDMKYYLNQHNGINHGVALALYDFTHFGCCTKAHKYKIWQTFNGISDIQYEWEKQF